MVRVVQGNDVPIHASTKSTHGEHRMRWGARSYPGDEFEGVVPWVRVSRSAATAGL